jgi:hypothetical protein
VPDVGVFAADIIGMSGFVIDGKVHAHVTLGVLNDGLDLSQIDDWNYR